MLSRALVVIAALAVLAGCTPAVQADSGRAVAAVPVLTNEIQVGDLSRSYIVRAPDASTNDVPMPLLVMLHGAGGDAEKAEGITGFSSAASSDGFVVAYPNGTAANEEVGELAWNAGACCGLARDRGVDDVSFVLAMIAELQAQYPIDASRIYLVGYSNGAMMSYRLACEHAELFAGIAVVSGALNYAPCTPTAPLSVLIVHGTGDLTVPYDGGLTNDRTASRFGQWSNTSVEYATSFWTDHDDCEPDAVVTTTDLTTTETYADCSPDTRVEVVTLTQGTHTWPLLTTLGVDGAALVLDFFDLD
jgi:polyhydroxybutyrate depolymerase